jgi:hypothetical protein
LYNPFRVLGSVAQDATDHYTKSNNAQISLHNQKSLGANMESGIFRNIMHYTSGSQIKIYEDNLAAPFEPDNLKSSNISAARAYVFSPDQIARMEAVVESRYSIYNRAMEYADEIDLRNTEYSDTNEVHDFLLKGKAAMEYVVPTLSDISDPTGGASTILGEVDLTTPGLNIISHCLSLDVLVCNNEYAQFLGEGAQSVLPTDPYTYGPMFEYNGEINVIYYDPAECCFGSWSSEAQTCVQGVDELATVDCSECEGTRTASAVSTYVVYNSIGLNLMKFDSNVLYSDHVVISPQSGCYYSYSKKERNSYKLSYPSVSKDKKDKTEKFNKCKDILNKMSNFAR